MAARLFYRKKVTVNTDPQLRCYNGCNFSEEIRWSEWELVAEYLNTELARSAALMFKSINPLREYRIDTGE